LPEVNSISSLPQLKVLNTNASITTAAVSHKISPDNSKATIDGIE